ncbi:MAG TPA: ATP-binding protein [Moraxellaceae bacterium]|nr:ATP-binding protein [Moraxellaceae bacterium]
MLNRSIARTLFAVITLLAFVLVLAMAGLFRVSLQHGFRTYVQSIELARLGPLEQLLLDRYAREESWGFLHGYSDIGRAVRPLPPAPPRGAWPPPGMGQGGLQVGPPGHGFGPPPDAAGAAPVEAAVPGAPPRGLDILALGPRAALLDERGDYVAGNRDALRTPRRALFVGEGGTRRLVGYLVLTAPPAAERQSGEDFVASQYRNLMGISLLVLLLSALAAWGLAAYFRRPVRALAEGTRRIAGGDFAARLPEERQDELGGMATDFNRMAEKLEAHELSRRQWMADTSHELRTPLTVLATHLEAMRDGVLPASPEKLQALSRTVEDMNRLVGDLALLATTEAGAHDYRYERVPVAGLLAELEDSFAPRLRAAGLVLTVQDETPAGTALRVDPLRMAQVLGNLLTNACRYTDAGGRVRIAARRSGDSVEILVEDSAPGVPPESLPRLFERFYRVEGSRSRQGGGSGLGLSICRAIVQAHGGTIAAAASPLGGLRVTLRLPLAPTRRLS